MENLSSLTPMSVANMGMQSAIPRGLRVPAPDASDQEIEGVAKQMEGVFFSMFVKEMRKTMIDGSLFGEGPGADTYEGFFDQMMGEHLGGGGGLGIAEMVVKNAMLNRERVTMDDLRASLATKNAERTTETIAVADEGETNERTKSEESKRG